MIIVPPSGMKYDLARQLVNDPTFAHMWLCHGGDHTQCPDGCAGESTSDDSAERTKQYAAIRVYHIERHVSAFKRGYSDQEKSKPPIFRRVGAVIQSELDDDMADEWCDEMRAAYLDGYERATPRTIGDMRAHNGF